MKLFWLIMLLVSVGCATVGKVADNLTTPGNAEETSSTIDTVLTGVKGPGGIDLGNMGIGGAVVTALGLLAQVLGAKKQAKEGDAVANKRIDKTKAEVDELYDENKRLAAVVADLQSQLLTVKKT